MTKDEIVTSLRACANMAFSDCDKCACKGKGIFDNPFTCVDNLRILAADLIENQQREIEALRQANRALRERQKWISATERLPEPETRVLVLDRRGNMMARTMRQLPTDKTPVFRPDGLMPGKDITHWMPLPEAPEVE